ncbi:MAG: competence protein ComEC [Myxococcota bacterium]|jgi:competence protein ComEC
MSVRYISDRTTTFYKAATGSSRLGYIIFGDELEKTGNAVGNRTPIEFRGRDGFVVTDDLTTEAALEYYAIDVGQGDATFIVTPNRTNILIDGGMNKRALGFLIWKYRLDIPANTVDIDLMVLTHADADHLNGLTAIVEHPQINVHKIVHNGIAVFGASGAAKLGGLTPDGERLQVHYDTLADLQALNKLSSSMVKWRDAVAAEGASYNAVDTSTGFIDCGDPAIQIETLGPRLEADGKFHWFGDTAHTINGHSVVLRLDYGDVAILLSGDLNVEGAENLMSDPATTLRMSAHLFKSPHHGSHEFDMAFLEAVRPQISTISSGDTLDHGHPRAVFLGALGLASRSTAPLIFSTEIAATFVGDGETADPIDGAAIDGLDFSTSTGNETARKRFKLLLPGIINVRTDGTNLYAHRRVNTGYQWESYGPIAPAPRPSIFTP